MLRAARTRAPELASALFVLIVSLTGSHASAQAMGTALSGPTTADGAAAYYNPAAMGGGRGTHLELQLGLTPVQVTYEPAGGTAPSSQAPIGPIVAFGGFTDAAHEQWRIGLTGGLSRSNGGAWRRDDGAAAITRYYLVEGQQFHLQAVPAVSFTPVEWITVGLGVNLAYGSTTASLDKDFGSEINQTAGSTTIDSPFPYAHPDLAAPVLFGGDGVGVGALGGVLVRPIPELTFGTSVHSPVIVPGRGSLAVEYPDELRRFVADTLPSVQLPDLTGSIDLELDVPLLFWFGVSAQPHPMVDVAAYYEFEHASSQPNFNIVISEATSNLITDQAKPQAYLDRHLVLLRAAVFPIPELRVAVYGSFQSNTIPEQTVAPNNLDFDRVTVGGVAQWRIVDEVSVLVQYGTIVLLDRYVATSLHRPTTQASLAAFNHPSPTGRYSASAHTVRIGAALHVE